MENKEILEGKKTDNLEATSASDEAKVEEEAQVVPEEKPAEEPVPDLANAPLPTEAEVEDAELKVEPEEVISEDAAPSEDVAPSDGISEGPEQSEAAPIEDAPVENVAELTVEENGVTEMPATKVFTQSQVNEMVGNTRTETREKTFRYIYDRYGVKDEAELDELVGNAQALDSFKEKYESERAGWKQTSADRDRELNEVKEQVALLQSGIDSDRFEDAKFILKGKGLEVSLDNIKSELATHPEWQKKAETGNEDFVKTGEGNIDMTKPTEPSSKISVLGNEEGAKDSAGSEEDFVMKNMFKI